ncbi:MAG: hypothetical protein MI919_36990, partial [Holophagales bacterium]|nr:hypothetical protein [Holophagales bacterium]
MARRRHHHTKGRCYRGTGDPESVARAIEAECRRAGMEWQRTDLRDGSICIEARLGAPWYRTLARSIPTFWTWRVERVELESRIYSETRMAGWHRGLFGGTAGLFFAALAAMAASRMTSEEHWLFAAGDILELPSVFLLLVLTHLALTNTDELGVRVNNRINRGGRLFEPEGSLVSRQRLRRAVLLLAGASVLLVQVVWAGISDGTLEAPAPILVLLGILVLGACLLVSAAALMLRPSGFALRVAPLATGLMTGLTVLLLTSPALLFAGGSRQLEVAALLEGATFLRGSDFPAGWNPEAATASVHARMREHYRSLQPTTWTMLAALLLPSILALEIFRRWAVLPSVTLARQLAGLNRNRERGLFRQATRGGRFLRRYRTVFGSIWVLFATVILV